MLVSRDPFAREELHRETIPKLERRGTCRWCGTGPGRFWYYVETDGGRMIDERSPLARFKSGPFCSVNCFRTFNGG